MDIIYMHCMLFKFKSKIIHLSCSPFSGDESDLHVIIFDEIDAICKVWRFSNIISTSIICYVVLVNLLISNTTLALSGGRIKQEVTNS